jgi:hypothetical protein
MRLRGSTSGPTRRSSNVARRAVIAPPCTDPHGMDPHGLALALVDARADSGQRQNQEKRSST